MGVYMLHQHSVSVMLDSFLRYDDITIYVVARSDTFRVSLKCHDTRGKRFIIARSYPSFVVRTDGTH